MKWTGGCQCGVIRYEVTGIPQQVCVCHCMDCQRQSGSAFAAVDALVPGAGKYKGKPAP